MLLIWLGNVVAYLDLSEHLLPDVDNALERHLAIYSLLSEAFLSSIWRIQNKQKVVST